MNPEALLEWAKNLTVLQWALLFGGAYLLRTMIPQSTPTFLEQLSTITPQAAPATKGPASTASASSAVSAYRTLATLLADDEAATAALKGPVWAGIGAKL